MLKVIYSEVVKDRAESPHGKLVEKTKCVGSLAEAVTFSRYIANTAHLVGRPVIVEE